MIRWLCPYCGRKLKAPESAVGRTGKCPTCRNRITVPPFSTVPGDAVETDIAPAEEPETDVTAADRSEEESAREFFARVRQLQGPPLPGDGERRETAPHPSAPPEHEHKTGASVSIEFVTHDEEDERAASAAPEGPAGSEALFAPTPTVARWPGRQYSILLLCLGTAAFLALLAEIGLVELARTLAARVEGGPDALLTVGLWQLTLLAGGFLVLLASFGGGLAVWVKIDASQRRTSALRALALTLLGNLVGAAVYLATRPLFQGEVREGGPGWNVCRYLAVLWIGWLMYSTLVLVGVLLWSLLRGLPVVVLVSGFLVTYLPSLVLWPLLCLALLGFLLRVNSVVEIGGDV